MISLAIALLSTAAAQDTGSLYRQGVDRQRLGDLKGAAEAYAKVLELDPENIAARSNRGVALAGLGRYDDAIPEYERALRSAPEQVRPYLQRNLALAFYKSGRLGEAAPLLIALHEAQPADRPSALLAADCMLQLGQPAKALSLLEPLSADSGNDKAFAYALGMAYLKTGKTAEAQRVLDPILQDKSSAEGNYALGLAMFTSGDYPAAVETLGRATQLNASLPHVWSYYGQALLFTGDADGALAAFQNQFAADANDYDANYESAQILLKKKKPAEAEPLVRRAVLLHPDSAAARLALAESLMGQSKWKESKIVLDAELQQQPEFGAAHARLAEVLAKSGMQAESARERALALKYAPAEARAAGAPGPRPGAIAPRFQLPRSDGSGSASLPVPEAGKPAVLVFGSYSCPNFRTAAPVLNELSKVYAGRVSFLLIYIHEAHSTDQWQSTINERERVQLAPVASIEQKHDYAMMCQRKLHLKFPSAIDGLNDAAEKAYGAWPSRVYVIAADGRVRYASGLIETEFDRNALEAAVRGASGARDRPADRKSTKH